MRIRSCACALVLLAACGGEAPSEVSRSRQAIIDGQPDTTHGQVFFLWMGTSSSEGMGCTATLVAPRVLLTARHCVLDRSPAEVGKPTCEQSFDVERAPKWSAATNLAVATQDASPRAVAKAHFEMPLGTLCGRDVALVELVEPVAGVAPISPRLDAPPAVDDTLTVVGYGDDGDTINADLVRRVRSDSVVQSVDAAWYHVNVGPCGGDSGGPALDAAGRVVGVMSRGNPKVCQNMIYERVDAHAEWLRTTVKAISNAKGDVVPAWAADGPAPADAAVDAVADAGIPDAAPPSGEPGSGAASSCGVGPVGTSHRSGTLAAAVAALALAFRRRAARG